MRVLVTGGAGFLGSHLCDRLLEDGHEVIALDNLFTGAKRNIHHLLDREDFEFLRHDVVNPVLLEVDWIFNLACPASPVHYQYNPVKTIKTSVLGSLHMLGLAKRVKARILQASTSEVYGDPQEHPQRESYWGHVNPIGPRSPYDEGKRFAEALSGQGPPLRILAAVSTHTTFLQYSLRDAQRALQSLGHPCWVLTERQPYEILSPLTYHQAIREWNPDLFLVLDHIRPEFQGILPTNLPMLTWDQDQLPHVFTRANIRRIARQDFLVG
ncbi:MAG: GDP-mannose 4,6-dehydratase, partial [Planctomycetes bacterium]|nr:GDP-mannose 4,6-dehydratase [Planctomycetota bacterium]